MNYNEFKDYVKEHVLDYLPEQYKNANMDIRQAVKNNDVVLDGLTILSQWEYVTYHISECGL